MGLNRALNWSLLKKFCCQRSISSKCPFPFTETLASEAAEDDRNEWTIENLELLDIDDDNALQLHPEKKILAENLNWNMMTRNKFSGNICTMHQMR
jgi:hypothetical protein